MGNVTMTQLLIEARANVESEDEHGNTPLSSALTVALKKPETFNIIPMLLLVARAPLKDVERFSREAQTLLRSKGFDHLTFDRDLKMSKRLLEAYTQGITQRLDACRIPSVIAALIIKYCICVDIHMSFFTQGRSLLYTKR
jgi:hypothetical protein